MTNDSHLEQVAGGLAASNSCHAGAQPARYRRILLPFDAGTVASRAFEEALALARECGARLELLHVFDPAAHVSGFEPARLLVDDLLPRARAQARATLEAAAQSARAVGVDCSACLIDGDATGLPDAIVGRAAQTGADLVVMGTHGRTGMDRVLRGSVAEQLLRRTNLPVLLVRVADDGGMTS